MIDEAALPLGGAGAEGFLHDALAALWGFVGYAFIFRMFFGLTLLRILISFIWIYGKIHRAREASKRLKD